MLKPTQLSSLPPTQVSESHVPQKTLSLVSLTLVPALQVVAVSVPPVPTTWNQTFLKGPEKTPQGEPMSSVAPTLLNVEMNGSEPITSAPEHSSFVTPTPVVAAGLVTLSVMSPAESWL